MTTKAYTVRLVDARDVPTPARITAEVRFAAALERELGGEEAVSRVQKAWAEANESEPTILHRETAELAVRWPRAFDRAQQAGLRELGDLGSEAHFEVRAA